jgi:hypothetical protein
VTEFDVTARVAQPEEGSTLYAISIHVGDGSMSEAMDSRGAFGFWTDPKQADKTAVVLYKHLAAVDPHFGQEGDVRVVPIVMGGQKMPDLIKAFVQEWKEERE